MKNKEGVKWTQVYGEISDEHEKINRQREAKTERKTNEKKNHERARNVKIYTLNIFECNPMAENKKGAAKM